MQLVDDHGRALDADYLVEADGGHLALIMDHRAHEAATPMLLTYRYGNTAGNSHQGVTVPP